MTEPEISATRTARCSCGGLRLSFRGEPLRVYACACLECQRATGSAFAYRARFHRNAVSEDEGERRRFRRVTEAGRWMDQIFCPACGSLVYMEAEAIPDELAVSVGCFSDSKFPPPAALFWARRKHDWYGLHEAVRLVE
ncbi:GFA family protein [Rhizobium sp. LCM 4573]|uniref:GFA family protein n=1 Tax=Rhizobium sp. LCM 4573 TaxID=1848291 RepID=UPI0008DB11F3|nr:GFA family protein [Rhizobium sp. LCM 4573]OHV76089.1 aldehyde-activating protein [Rhizobium sp. LCM 4573]